MSYLLEFKLPKGKVHKKEVQDVLTFGTDSSNSFSLQDHGLAARHLTFRCQNGVLSMTSHVDNSKILLGRMRLNHGKIYLIEKGDTISIDDNIVITVDPQESSSTKDTDQTLKPVAKKVVRQQAKRRKFTQPVNRLGVIGRLYAFFFELVISAALYLVVIIPQGFSSFFSSARETVLSLIAEQNIPYKEFLSKDVLNVFFIYVALNLASSLLVSATFSQAIMNLRTKGNFLLARIKAVVRFLLGLVTGPVLIFDIPAVFGWPTLKEVLTFSKVGYESNFMRFFGMVLLPIISFFILLIPILSNYHTLSRSQYMKMPILKKTQSGDVTQTLSLHHISIQKPLEENERLLPFFDYKNDEVYPKILFLDIEKELSIVYGPAQFFYPFQIGINKIIELDPLFPHKFPNIYSYYKHKNSENGEELSLNKEEYLKELSFLYQSVFSLNLEQIPPFITKVSPFITPYLKFKKSLMMNLFSSIGGQITEFTVGDVFFFEYENLEKNIYKIFHVSEFLDRDIVWNTEFDQKSKRLYMKFELNFIKRARPTKLHSEEGIPKDAFNTFDLVDFLYRAKDYKHNVKHYRMILSFFKKRIEDAGDNEYYKNALADSIRSFSDAYGKLKDISPERQKTLQTLLQRLNDLLVTETSEGTSE